MRQRQAAPDIELQAQALEALIHAVEDERLSVKQVEAALERNRQAKERFLREWRPPTAAQLQTRDRLRAASRDFRTDGGVRLNRMLKPQRLRPGDKIAVVAPASPFSREEFDKGVAELRRLGFEPVFDESVFAQHGGYLSGDGQRRAHGISRGVARSVGARAHRGARRIRQRAPASVSREADLRADAESVHRLQRSHDGAHVPHDALWHRLVPRADARSAAGPRHRRATIATRSCGR